jgi:hypothetical protein
MASLAIAVMPYVVDILGYTIIYTSWVIGMENYKYFLMQFARI